MNQREEMDVSAAVDQAIRGRRAVRCFLDIPVEKELVAEILDVARAAPSNSNIQPWRVYIVAGEAKKKLSEEILDAHCCRAAEHTASYKHFPDTLAQEFSCRREDFASRYYESLGICRTDQAARDAQTGRNYQFFGAPVGFIFTMNSALERGSWLDYGIFLQSVMIAAKARGLDTCPQISFAKYHSIIRRHLHIPLHEVVVCGMSMGYGDPAAPVNSLRLPREELGSFTSFFGFDGD
ncbi:nitroreductase [Undibacterium sp. TJN25]|uniref:nitroreductase n=1 Tax=Undibacterium sp. TJN25 TaxID=3413056 RepID=UPI003BEFB6B1